MKINKIFANGCSFTYGGGLHWDEVKEIYRNELDIVNAARVSFAKEVKEIAGEICESSRSS